MTNTSLTNPTNVAAPQVKPAKLSSGLTKKERASLDKWNRSLYELLTVAESLHHLLHTAETFYPAYQGDEDYGGCDPMTGGATFLKLLSQIKGEQKALLRAAIAAVDANTKLDAALGDKPVLMGAELFDLWLEDHGWKEVTDAGETT